MRFLSALAALTAGATLILLGEHSPFVRMAGIALVLISIYFIRRAQVARARLAPVSISTAEQRDRRVIKAVYALLTLGLGTLVYLAISGLATTPIGSKVMLILLGALLALLGGLVSYYSAKRWSKSP